MYKQSIISARFNLFSWILRILHERIGHAVQLPAFAPGLRDFSGSLKFMNSFFVTCGSFRDDGRSCLAARIRARS